jgi:hypothetical protein
LTFAVRVDVAVLNGHLAGYELKSERDTLRRLPARVQVYSGVLDWATLVVAERHVEHARPLLPDWWGILIASSAESDVRLDPEREPRPNPAVNAEMLVRLRGGNDHAVGLQRLLARFAIVGSAASKRMWELRGRFLGAG